MCIAFIVHSIIIQLTQGNAVRDQRRRKMASFEKEKGTPEGGSTSKSVRMQVYVFVCVHVCAVTAVCVCLCVVYVCVIVCEEYYGLLHYCTYSAHTHTAHTHTP